MSRLGFNLTLRKISGMEQTFFREAIKLARLEWKDNFDNESSAESGPWPDVIRKKPPPILEETTKLRMMTIQQGTLLIGRRMASVTIDPIDNRGRGYAQYHEDGIGVKKREFVTQSSTLTSKQKSLLLALTHKMFS